MRPGDLVAIGRTSDVYAFGVGSVVKVPRVDVPDHWALLESEFTSAVHTLGVPAPKVMDVTQVDGRHAVVFERIEGRSMWEHMLDEPRRIPELAQVLADTQRRIFAAGPPEGLHGQVDRMRVKLDDVDQLPPSERVEATDMAEALPKGAALLHGDLHPGNVLMTPDGPIVIDWFDASVGHPIADVVRSSLLMRVIDGPRVPGHLPGATVAMITELHLAYISAMSDLLMPSFETLGRWEALMAASRLAEGSQSDESTLVRLWRARLDLPSRLLGDDLSSAAGRSASETAGRDRDRTP